MFKYALIMITLLSFNSKAVENIYNLNYNYDLKVIKDEKEINIIEGVFEPLPKYTKSAIKNVNGTVVF